MTPNLGIVDENGKIKDDACPDGSPMSEEEKKQATDKTAFAVEIGRHILSYCYKNEEFFLSMKPHLVSSFWITDNLKVLWRVLDQHYKEYECLPDEALAEDAIGEHITKCSDLLSVRGELKAMLNGNYGLDNREIKETYIKKAFERIQEREGLLLIEAYLKSGSLDNLREGLDAVLHDAHARDIKEESFGDLMTFDEFMARDFNQKFLIDNVIIKGQNFVIGGRQKTLKTNIACDLMISLASGRPFLGRFTVNEPVRVGFWSGESGGTSLQNTMRSICKARGIGGNIPLFTQTMLPNLSDDEHLRRIKEKIIELELNVITFDPFYLAKGNSDGKESNLFVMGSFLNRLSVLTQETGVTMILLHHFREKKPGSPISLSDLAQTGLSEWCRQWLLVDRIGEYDKEKPHELLMKQGGQAWHTTDYHLTIDEGDHDKWEVGCETMKQHRDKKSLEKEVKVNNDQQQVIDVLTNEWQTVAAISRKVIHSDNTTGRILKILVGCGKAELITKASGEFKEHGTIRDGYRASSS